MEFLLKEGPYVSQNNCHFLLIPITGTEKFGLTFSSELL
jgi:hypothetical protein